MTAHSLNLTRDGLDQFVVFDPEDPANASICFGEEQARETVSFWKDPSVLRVRRITEGEPARDVTEDFIPADDDDEPMPKRGRSHLVTGTRGHSYYRDGGL